MRCEITNAATFYDPENHDCNINQSYHSHEIDWNAIIYNTKYNNVIKQMIFL